jgi:aprataxin and PNK-like factor
VIVSIIIDIRIPRDDTVLSRGPSILRSYSILTEEERKELIRRAFELKDLLKKVLNETQRIIVEKNKMLKRVHSQLEKTSRIEGELEALEKDEVVYFPLFAEREYKAGSAAQIHFRLAGILFSIIHRFKEASFKLTAL